MMSKVYMISYGVGNQELKNKIERRKRRRRQNNSRLSIYRKVITFSTYYIEVHHLTVDSIVNHNTVKWYKVKSYSHLHQA